MCVLRRKFSFLFPIFFFLSLCGLEMRRSPRSFGVFFFLFSFFLSSGSFAL